MKSEDFLQAWDSAWAMLAAGGRWFVGSVAPGVSEANTVPYVARRRGHWQIAGWLLQSHRMTRSCSAIFQRDGQAARFGLSRRNRQRRLLLLPLGAFFLSLMLSMGPCCAADSLLSTTWEDTKLYFTSPLRWDTEDWLYFGGALVAIGASHSFDERVRDHFATGSKAVLNGGQDKNSLRDAAPTLALIAGTGLAAAFFDDHEGYQEAWSLIEAGAFSGVTAEISGYAIGRERPDATTSANAWRKGGDSMPSLHTTVAFAVGTVFAESGNDEYRWLRRIIGYGVASATGYVRISENVHWLSDSIAGAALGIATARFVLNRQSARDRSVSLEIQPVKNGLMVSYNMRTH